MSVQTRPPKKLISAIMADILANPIISARAIDETTRKHLNGTKFRYPKSSELIAVYRETKTIRPEIEKLLRVKQVRTDSGVAPITVLTKPYPCPGKCVYCPTEVRMPKSYVASEPAAARALSLHFDPYDQVAKRVQMLERNGHEAKKIELIVKGGTWSAYPWPYRVWFIKRCFDAANHLNQKKLVRYHSLAQSQKANESADYRIIGITLETRPDWITPKEIARLRELGCTRIELGVQAIDDHILKTVNRGHIVQDVVRATALLKAVGFKLDYHFMPGLPGSNAKKDIQMFAQLFTDPRFCPDMVKLYPCVVLPSTELIDWYHQGKFKPLEGEALIDAMVQMKSMIPHYCRLSRLVRDFPANEITGGNKTSNLRDVIKERMRQQNLKCRCLRCREAGHRPLLDKKTNIKLFTDIYDNAGGKEYFLSAEDPKRTTVLSFLRLRLPNQVPIESDKKTDLALKELKKVIPEIRDAAFVRELHTYGQALRIGQEKQEAVQHKGWGRKLMEEAERIAKAKGYKYLVVISGVGVRGYYRMLG
ncbi:MAG TPA: tRNA uridine(34) 5-carboxymethylaminomethyl modification radical SAM/GNAT enzyme Elp3, partial [Patescibacteria group bacterium]|nr:tRNA uridine(34) 5-carboxymethylaminomethyl modification radical SAM/GNAT enzyme Elp3 [Patescibacteria group bacterium]